MPDDEHDTRLLSHARPRDWQNPEPKSRYNLGAENGFYPTRAEAIKKAADAYNRRRMTPRARALLQRWFAWRR